MYFCSLWKLPLSLILPNITSSKTTIVAINIITTKRLKIAIKRSIYGASLSSLAKPHILYKIFWNRFKNISSLYRLFNKLFSNISRNYIRKFKHGRRFDYKSYSEYNILYNCWYYLNYPPLVKENRKRKQKI